MTSTSDLQSNFDQARHLIEGAARRGADVVFLPEAFDFIGSSSADTLELAQPISGSTVRSFQELAQTNKVWLSLGGFHHKSNRDGAKKIFNTHLIIDSAGSIIDSYSKAHLFDVEIPGKFRLKESDYVNPGNHIPSPVATPLGNVGLGVCYDIRFPEFSLALAKGGAEILTFPSAFTVPTGMAHWKPLLQARAIENQCCVVAAAQVGRHNEKR